MNNAEKYGFEMKIIFLIYTYYNSISTAGHVLTEALTFISQ